ncbi:hypothetical protein Tco_1465167 [Tanacetum coccineum]
MNQNLSNSNSSGFDQFQPPQYPVIHHSPQETSEEVLQAREDLMKAIQTFLRKFSRIPFGEIPKVLLIAWERFSEIKHAFTDKQYQQEDIQELMSKLLEDVRNINEELSEFINSPSWNRPTFYNDDDEYTVIYRKPKEITPNLPIEEPDNSLSMGDEHLNTISETEKSSVENLVPIPSEFKGISEDICDVPSCDNDHFDAEFGLINSCAIVKKFPITSPKIDFLPEEFAAEKPHSFLFPFVLENPSSSPIPVVDSDFLIEEVDTFLVPEDSIPLVLRMILDSGGPDAPVINNFDELNEDECFNPGGGEIDVFANVEDDDYFPFIFVIRIFLSYLTYPEDCPDFEDSRVRCFVHRSLALQSFASLYWESDILNLIDQRTDIKEMDKIKAKTDKAGHEKERT